jgi:hypothetical protein
MDPDGPINALVAQNSDGQSNARAPVTPHAFRIAELPSANLPEPLPPNSAPMAMPAGDAPTDLEVSINGAKGIIARVAQKLSAPTPPTATLTAPTSMRVLLVDHKVGRIRIGFTESGIVAGTGGVYVTCGGGDVAGRRPLPARWESLDAEGADGARFTVTNAWFDPVTCKLVVVGRASVVAKSIADGVLFAYRQTCASCASGESLVVLGPRLDHLAAAAVGGDVQQNVGSVTRVLLPIRRGGGGSILAAIASTTLTGWFEIFPSHGHVGGEALVGVELLQGVGDSEPTAIAYVNIKASTLIAPSNDSSLRR